MPKVVVFSDIHGNLAALEAVWRDIQRRMPEHLICLGDLVAFGPRPAETLDFLLEEIKPDIILRGNTDTYLLEKVWQAEGEKLHDDFILENLSWTADQLGEKRLGQLKELSGETLLTVEGLPLFLCHAAPGSEENGITRATLGSFKEPIARLDSKVVLCGHTHVPLRTRIGDTRVLNPGSVGFPTDRDFRPSYLHFFIGDGALQEITFCRVPYGRGKSIEYYEKEDIPGAAVFIHRLRTATNGKPKLTS